MKYLVKYLLLALLIGLGGVYAAYAVTSPPVNLPITITAPPPPPAAPTMVQHDSGSSTRWMAFAGPPFCYYYQLPNATLAGNAVMASSPFGSNLIPSVTDDAGNTYAIGKTFYDAGDNTSIAVLGAFNVNAGARLISFCFPSDPGFYVQPMATEFANVTGFDGAGSANNGNSTTAAPGALSPTVTGDLIYQVTANIGCPDFTQCQASYAPQSPANLPMSLLSADVIDGLSAQYGVYGATASVSPTMGMGTSMKWISAAVALKSGATGSVPTGLRIVHLLHSSLTVFRKFGDPVVPYPNPTHFQFPSSGNLLVTQITGGGDTCCNVTSVTDTSNPSWLQTAEIKGNCCSMQTFYVPNAITTNNLGITYNWTSSTSAPDMMFYDIAGAATAPFDASNGNFGDDTTSIDTNNGIATGYTITPAQPNDIILSHANWDDNVGIGIDGQNFLSNTFDGTREVNNAPTLVDEQGGSASYITPNTSAVSFTWRMIRGTPAGEVPYPGNWTSISAAFKGASSTPPPPPPTASLSASPTSVTSGGSSTLTWSSTNAPSCVSPGALGNTAIPSFTGATSGSKSTGALTTTTTYSVQCGTATASATVTVTGGGGGNVACAKGPNFTGTIPAQAVAAGFNTCVVNYDMSQPSWANVSTWLQCDRGATPGPGTVFSAGGGGQVFSVPCPGAIAQITDPTYGGTVVDFPWLQGYPAPGSGIIMSTTTNASVEPFTWILQLPLMYIEARYRYDSSNINIGCSNCTSTGQVWTSGVAGEMDFGELYANPVQADGGGGSLAWATGDSTLPAGYSTDTYHTYGVLATGTAAGPNAFECYYVDNIFQPLRNPGCLNNYATLATTNRSYMLISITGDPASPTYHWYLEWIHIFSCANWQSDACAGTTLNSGPNSFNYYSNPS